MRVLGWLGVACLGMGLACGGRTQLDGSDAGAGVGPLDAAPALEAGDGSDGAVVRPPAGPATKVDVLFMVQNSPAMAGIPDLLPGSVAAFIDRLLNPNCVDASGAVLRPSQAGQCAVGSLEFAPVHDLHLAMVTSSIGSRGGDGCPADAPNPVTPQLSAHEDDRGELVNRAGSDDHPLTDAEPANFLAWFPAVPGNVGQPRPPVKALGAQAPLVSDFQQIVAAAGLHGCGFTAPLESWYRFLIQPDPYDQVVVSGGVASLVGVDATILAQRHDFLRPDSAVAVVVIANENDRSVDPLSIAGQGWAFENLKFPGSPLGTAPEGTIECQATPLSSACNSCAFLAPTMPGFATECPPDPPSGAGGYLDPSDDSLNLRFFHMKQRFGLDPQFPVARYASGLSAAAVPDRSHEHDTQGNYAPSPSCTNPLYAASLPAAPTDELCHLPVGPRSPDEVFLLVVGGVPHQLLAVDPTDPSSAQKGALGASDWAAILGADPLGYDFSGADFHMLESETPRPQSPCPQGSSDTCDPINGREWNTNKTDLEFACTFPLATPLDCTAPQNFAACACQAGAIDEGSPICLKSGRMYENTQIAARAYPTLRPLVVARNLGAQAVVSSICPIHPPTTSTPDDPLYGFRPGLSALIDRMGPRLARQ